jgi:hypothetical protein
MVPYSEMPGTSRVWIYQSGREFTDGEANELRRLGELFVNNWSSHNKSLLTSFEIRYNRFIILMVDEAAEQPSGCSIDKSMNFIRQLEERYKTSLLDRMQFAWKEGDDVFSLGKEEFEKKLTSGEIHASTIVFNNLVKNKSEFESQWEIPFKNSWHRDLFAFAG